MSGVIEPILNDDIQDNRFTLFPIKHLDIWKMYKIQVASFWTVEEVDLSNDLEDWHKLSDEERHFIKNVLAFFAGSDGIVNENLVERFSRDVKLPEARCFYDFQASMENIHCVSADTEILTDKGYFKIGYLARTDPFVAVWNGKEFSHVQIIKTSDESKLYDVYLSNGMKVTCTSQHKWLISEEKNEERIFTENLKQNMKLSSFEYPDNVAFNYVDQEIFSLPYEHGKECGNYKNTHYDIIKFNMRPKYQVPLNYSFDTQTRWLSGLFSFANMNEEKTRLEIFSDRMEFLQQVQLMLTCFNIRSRVFLKNNEKCLQIIDKHNVRKMAEKCIALPISWTELHDYDKYTEEDNTIRVMGVIKKEDKEPTYCFNEPLRHTGIFNGILTGQSEMYSLTIEQFIDDQKEKNHLFNAIDTIPCVKKKADWALKWIQNKEASFATRLIAFACVEGIFFSGAFCAIFWLKERGVMPGLCLSNEFISRDEGLHTEFACLLYANYVVNKLPEEEVQNIIKDAVEIETEFIVDSLPCHLLGMNADMMAQYIKFVADRLIFQLGYNKIWHVSNPFEFMDRICMESKSNFFEHTRLSEYSKANVGNDNFKPVFEFSKDEDF